MMVYSIKHRYENTAAENQDNIPEYQLGFLQSMTDWCSKTLSFSPAALMVLH
jgi:hypothetical protein